MKKIDEKKKKISEKRLRLPNSNVYVTKNVTKIKKANLSTRLKYLIYQALYW